jgi:hypothetical protein
MGFFFALSRPLSSVLRMRIETRFFTIGSTHLPIGALMKTLTHTTAQAITLACIAAASTFAIATSAQAQDSTLKIKDGDKIKIAYSRYDVRGREVYVANTEAMDTSVSATDKNYTWASPLATTTYVRDTHVAFERIAPNSAKETFPDKEQLKWFPTGGDFSKLAAGEQVIRNQRCGEGTFKYTPSHQSVKFKLSIAGKEQEIDAHEVTLKGRWAFASCGSGDQVMRFVYSPQLDFVLERDLKSFLPNGIFNNGNLMKVTAVN